MKTQSKLRILLKYFLIWINIIFICMVLMYTNLYDYIPTFYNTFLCSLFLTILFLNLYVFYPQNYFVCLVSKYSKYLEFIMCEILWGLYHLVY